MCNPHSSISEVPSQGEGEGCGNTRKLAAMGHSRLNRSGGARAYERGTLISVSRQQETAE